MRKQILVLLSVLGLAASFGPASAEEAPKGKKTDHTVKASNTWKSSKAPGKAQASGKRIESGQTTNVIPPGPNVLKTHRIPPGANTMNPNASRADKLGNFQAGPTKTLNLNPQPLPPGVHTLNPQPLPPGVHTGNTVTLNPQPNLLQFPGVHLVPVIEGSRYICLPSLVKSLSGAVLS